MPHVHCYADQTSCNIASSPRPFCHVSSCSNALQYRQRASAHRIHRNSCALPSIRRDQDLHELRPSAASCSLQLWVRGGPGCSLHAFQQRLVGCGLGRRVCSRPEQDQLRFCCSGQARGGPLFLQWRRQESQRSKQQREDRRY